MMNLGMIMSALQEVSTPQRRGDVLSTAEAKLYTLGKKLAKLEGEYEQLDTLVKFIKKLD
jgi:hypothetical protein